MGRPLSRLSLVVLVALILAAPAVARNRAKAAPITPGTYAEWGGEIDLLEILEPLKLTDFTRIVVEPFDTKETPLPESSDNTFGPVKAVLAEPAVPFTVGLTQELGGRMPVTREAGGEGKILVIHVKVVKMDPGSKAARYWASFGAGAARTELQGEVADASGRPLLRFHQERRSGFGAFGGDYEDLMNRNLQQIGEDVARILKAF